MNQPNNVCVLKRVRPDGNGTKIVYCVVTRYNFSPEPLGGQHREYLLFECSTLTQAVAEALAVGHFNHSLAVCCSFSLSKRAECAPLSVFRRDPGQVDGLPSESPEWFGPAESEVG